MLSKATQAFGVGLSLLRRTGTDLRDVTFSLQSGGCVPVCRVCLCVTNAAPGRHCDVPGADV